jgi:hypothetical protein
VFKTGAKWIHTQLTFQSMFVGTQWSSQLKARPGVDRTREPTSVFSSICALLMCEKAKVLLEWRGSRRYTKPPTAQFAILGLSGANQCNRPWCPEGQTRERSKVWGQAHFCKAESLAAKPAWFIQGLHAKRWLTLAEVDTGAPNFQSSGVHESIRWRGSEAARG